MQQYAGVFLSFFPGRIPQRFLLDAGRERERGGEAIRRMGQEKNIEGKNKGGGGSQTNRGREKRQEGRRKGRTKKTGRYWQGLDFRVPFPANQLFFLGVFILQY